MKVIIVKEGMTCDVLPMAMFITCFTDFDLVLYWLCEMLKAKN